MTKRTLTVALACTVVLIPLVYWIGISAPKKEVVFKREMVQDDLTKEVLPIYAAHYKWDGVEQQVPHWMIFKKYGDWKVLELKKVSKPDEAINQSVESNAEWIDKVWFLSSAIKMRISTYDSRFSAYLFG